MSEIPREEKKKKKKKTRKRRREQGEQGGDDEETRKAARREAMHNGWEAAWERIRNDPEARMRWDKGKEMRDAGREIRQLEKVLGPDNEEVLQRKEALDAKRKEKKEERSQLREQRRRDKRKEERERVEEEERKRDEESERRLESIREQWEREKSSVNRPNTWPPPRMRDDIVS
jgi:hypothetical protein